jgi:hypothetical protein
MWGNLFGSDSDSGAPLIYVVLQNDVCALFNLAAPCFCLFVFQVLFGK